MTPILLLATLAGCRGPAPSPAAPSLLVVTVDTWRADHLDPVHAPETWRRAREGWRFTDAWTPIGLTSPAHASLFTGRFPWEHGMRANNHHGSVLPAQETTLAEHLGAAGFATAAFVSAWPAGPSGGLDQGFAVFQGPEAGERPGSDAVAEARTWLGELAPEQRFLLWVHVFEPHGPYTPPEQDLGATGGGTADRDRYGGEVHAADRFLGPLYDDAAERGDVLVVVAGDHGEVLDEEPCGVQHERSTHDVVLRVPLAIWGPGVAPGVRAERLGLVDVAPTALGLLGVAPLPGVEGTSYATAATPGRATWPAESGLCEAACAPGCAPPGIPGRDRVVIGHGWRVTDRPGRGRFATGAGAPPSGDWDRLFEGFPPAVEPEGTPDEARGRALGYLDPPAEAPPPPPHPRRSAP